MIVPARAQLPASYRGTKLGYRVLNLDTSIFSAFTTRNVEEFSPATWVVSGGIEAPNVGGYIVWGTKGKDIVGATIYPQPIPPPNVTPAIDLELLIQRFASLIPKHPAVTVNTATFETAVKDLRAELVRVLLTNKQEQTAEISQQNALIAQRVSSLQAELQGNAEEQRSGVHDELSGHFAQLSTTLQQLANLGMTAQRLDEMSGVVMRMLNVNTSVDLMQAVVGKLEVLRTEMQKMNQAVTDARQAEDVRQKSVAAVEEFLEEILRQPDESEVAG